MCCCCCCGFLNTLKFYVEATIFGLVITLCTLSSKDPFKSHIIGDISNYFKILSNTSDSAENVSIIETSLMNPSYMPENISQEYFNNSYDFIDIKYLLKEKRKLASDSFCVDMEESFKRNEGQKLSYIFDLRYQTIRKINIALIIIILSFILLTIAAIIVAIMIKKNRTNCLEILGIIISIMVFFTWIAKFVLSLLLLYFIESSDIGKYDDFLECKNVKVKFFDKFTDVDKLRKIFLAFAVLNIISESIDKANEIFELGKREDNTIKGDSKINATA